MSRIRALLAGMLGVVLALLMWAGSGSDVGAINDGSINCHSASPANTYCGVNGADGAVVTDLKGQPLVQVALADLEAAVAPPEGWTVLAEANGATIGILADGRYVSAYNNTERGEVFVVAWEGCGASTINTGDLTVLDANNPSQVISTADGCGEDGPGCEVICLSAWLGFFDREAFEEGMTCEALKDSDPEAYEICLIIRSEFSCFNTCDGLSACNRIIEAVIAQDEDALTEEDSYQCQMQISNRFGEDF
ncbi:hypothetical protein ACFLYO_05525 [Chloroflexota bacterium]